MKVALKRCPLCGSTGIRPVRVDRAYRVAGVERHVRGIEAQVCRHCGEAFLDVAALEQIDRALGRKRRGRKPARCGDAPQAARLMTTVTRRGSRWRRPSDSK